MTDKNGREIKTGDVVRIDGSYFKSSNGLYFVTHSPGDITWRGKDHCLTKLGATGKVSTAKNSTEFWPVVACVSDHFKNLEAKAWNKEHATIEVVDFPREKKRGIAEYFEAERDDLLQRADYWSRHTQCEFSSESERLYNAANHYDRIAKAVVA